MWKRDQRDSRRLDDGWQSRSDGLRELSGGELQRRQARPIQALPKTGAAPERDLVAELAKAQRQITDLSLALHQQQSKLSDTTKLNGQLQIMIKDRDIRAAAMEKAIVKLTDQLAEQEVELEAARAIIAGFQKQESGALASKKRAGSDTTEFVAETIVRWGLSRDGAGPS